MLAMSVGQGHYRIGGRIFGQIEANAYKKLYLPCSVGCRVGRNKKIGEWNGDSIVGVEERIRP